MDVILLDTGSPISEHTTVSMNAIFSPGSVLKLRIFFNSCVGFGRDRKIIEVKRKTAA